MRRGLLFLLLTLLPSTAFPYSKATEYLLQEQIRAGCESRGGSFISVDERDLTNDGKSDLIIDHGDIRCHGDNPRSVLCGAAACEILIYVRRANLLKLEDSFMSVGYQIENDRSPPNIETIGFQFQKSTIRWNGRKFGPGGAFAERESEEWNYDGRYPIGLTANYATETTAIGFACSESGGYAAAMRLSPELIPGSKADGGIVFIFEDLQHGSTYNDFPTKFDSHLEHMLEPACAEFEPWRNNPALYIIRGNGQIEAAGPTTQLFTITQGDRSISLRTVGDLAQLKNVVRIPLKGAGKAIDHLIRACPAIKRNQELSCASDPH